MDFISNQEPQNQEMLDTIGLTLDQLLADIPKELRLPKPIHDDGLSEYEAMRHLESLASKNRFSSVDSYLGAGAYEHHVPAIAQAICSKSEFLTSYTPYQPEASQGMLQAIFEFQSALCALTGLDVSNASLYDGASACAEGLLMALRCQKGRNKVLVAEDVHPHYQKVVEQYLCHPEIVIEKIKSRPDGTLDQHHLDQLLDSNTAGILLQCPNFYGIITDIKAISAKAQKKGALIVLCANPLAYGLYASAKELGADIAVGDCQPLGLPLQFGGPYAGYITCRQELVRQLPGRIAGETLDSQGRRGFVLTLQAREQHIRREKATSNICTNQALAALATLVTILWYGKEGLHALALTNYQRATYLKKLLTPHAIFLPLQQQPTFNEFVVQFKKPAKDVQSLCRTHGIEPGLHLGDYDPRFKDCFLIAVTETKTKEQLDRFVNVIKTL